LFSREFAWIKIFEFKKNKIKIIFIVFIF